MCDFLSHEAQEIGGELVNAWLCRNGCKGSILPFDVGLVGQCARELVEQLLRLFGEDMFNQRLDVDIA